MFQHKAIEDNVLTNDETLECQKIIEEISEKINNIKYGSEIDRDNKIESKKTRKNSNDRKEENIEIRVSKCLMQFK